MGAPIPGPLEDVVMPFVLSSFLKTSPLPHIVDSNRKLL